MVSIQQTDAVYRINDSGIHEFVFLAPTQQAIHDFFQFLTKANMVTQYGQTLRFVVDTSIDGIPSPSMLIRMAQQWRSITPDYATVRSLFVTDSEVGLILARAFAQMISGILPRWHWHFVTRAQYHTGLDWLLTED